LRDVPVRDVHVMVIGKVFKCPKFRMEYDRDMNAAISPQGNERCGTGLL